MQGSSGQDRKATDGAAWGVSFLRELRRTRAKRVGRAQDTTGRGRVSSKGEVELWLKVRRGTVHWSMRWNKEAFEAFADGVTGRAKRRWNADLTAWKDLKAQKEKLKDLLIWQELYRTGSCMVLFGEEESEKRRLESFWDGAKWIL